MYASQFIFHLQSLPIQGGSKVVSKFISNFIVTLPTQPKEPTFFLIVTPFLTSEFVKDFLSENNGLLVIEPIYEYQYNKSFLLYVFLSDFIPFTCISFLIRHSVQLSRITVCYRFNKQYVLKKKRIGIRMMVRNGERKRIQLKLCALFNVSYPEREPLTQHVYAKL